ncbi:hypothetical protein MKX03_001862 [Papaver bracteatum]|nr:hypothetical protein MKX03_001862 [Papaver bracteatum]
MLEEILLVKKEKRQLKQVKSQGNLLIHVFCHIIKTKLRDQCGKMRIQEKIQYHCLNSINIKIWSKQNGLLMKSVLKFKNM